MGFRIEGYCERDAENARGPAKVPTRLQVIVECHTPTYVDVNVLLKLIVPEGLLRQLKQVAGWPDMAPTTPNELAERINKLIETVTEVACSKLTGEKYKRKNNGLAKIRWITWSIYEVFINVTLD